MSGQMVRVEVQEMRGRWRQQLLSMVTAISLTTTTSPFSTSNESGRSLSRVPFRDPCGPCTFSLVGRLAPSLGSGLAVFSAVRQRPSSRFPRSACFCSVHLSVLVSLVCCLKIRLNLHEMSTQAASFVLGSRDQPTLQQSQMYPGMAGPA